MTSAFDLKEVNHVNMFCIDLSKAEEAEPRLAYKLALSSRYQQWLFISGNVGWVPISFLEVHVNVKKFMIYSWSDCWSTIRRSSGLCAGTFFICQLYGLRRFSWSKCEVCKMYKSPAWATNSSGVASFHLTKIRRVVLIIYLIIFCLSWIG